MFDIARRISKEIVEEKIRSLSTKKKRKESGFRFSSIKSLKQSRNRKVAFQKNQIDHRNVTKALMYQSRLFVEVASTIMKVNKVAYSNSLKMQTKNRCHQANLCKFLFFSSFKFGNAIELLTNEIVDFDFFCNIYETMKPTCLIHKYKTNNHGIKLSILYLDKNPYLYFCRWRNVSITRFLIFHEFCWNLKLSYFFWVIIKKIHIKYKIYSKYKISSIKPSNSNLYV